LLASNSAANEWGACAEPIRLAQASAIAAQEMVGNCMPIYPARIDLPLQAGRPTQVLDILVVFVADVLHEIPARAQPRLMADRERLRVRAGVDDRGHVLEGAVARARVAVHGPELARVRVPQEVEPEQLVEADGIDDQRLAFPMPHRMPVPRGIRIL